jgi:hypothetical protein
MKFTESALNKVPYSQEYFSVLEKEKRLCAWLSRQTGNCGSGTNSSYTVQVSVTLPTKGVFGVVTSLSTNKPHFMAIKTPQQSKLIFSLLCIENKPRDEINYPPQTVTYVNIRPITCVADDKRKPRCALPLVFPVERYGTRNQNTSVNKAWSVITPDQCDQFGFNIRADYKEKM